jgi:hypothetical protein
MLPSEKGINMKTILRPLAWVIVVTCWFFYGLIILVDLIEPPKQQNPIKQITEGFEQMKHHLQFNLVMFMIVLAYILCWAYLKEEKESKQ